MASVEVCGINIQYDDTVDDIDRIIKIIKLNEGFFDFYKGKTFVLGKNLTTDNEDMIYISNFDEFFDKILESILSDNKIHSFLNSPELLQILHIEYWVRKVEKYGNASPFIKSNMPYDVLLLLTAFKYFNCESQFNEFSDFLKYRENPEKMFNWLNETQRFNTYNFCLEILLDYLKQYDVTFFHNISNIIDYVYDKITPQMEKELFSDKKLDLTVFDYDNFESMFLLFLNSINAPHRWKEEYYKLKNENRIIFEKKLDNFENSYCFKDDDGVWKIKVIMDGTITSFITFVHEFMHYISLHNYLDVSIKDGIPYSLTEFPSIFYERLASNYLIDAGYNENTVKNIILFRDKDNIFITSSLVNILIDLFKINRGVQISRDNKIKSLKESAMAYENRENIDTSNSYANLNYNFGEIADEDCDKKIIDFVKKGFLVLDGYQYLTDSYLADSLLEKTNIDDILDKMVYVTEHLKELDIDKIVNYFGINETREKSKKIKK